MGGPAHMAGSYETYLARAMLTQARDTEVELGDDALSLPPGEAPELVAEKHTVKVMLSVASKSI